MRFSLLKKGSIVFLLSFLVLSISLVSFSGLALAKHDKDKKCKPSVKPIEAQETGAGFGGFGVHAKCLPPNTSYFVSTNLSTACPAVSSNTQGGGVVVSGLGGHIDIFVTFGPSLACTPGNYLVLLTKTSTTSGGGFAIPLEIDCCSTTDTD